MPGGHTSSTTPPSYASAHTSVARHAGEAEGVRDGVRLCVPVPVAVPDGVRERVRLGVLTAVREGGAPRDSVRVIVGVPGGVLVGEGMTQSSSAHRYLVRLGHGSGLPDGA